MTTRTRTTAEVEAGAIGIVAAIYRLTPNEARADWERKDNYLYSRDWFLGQSQSCLAAADAAAPAVGVTVDDFADALSVAIGTALGVGAMSGNPANADRMKKAEEELRARKQRVFNLFCALLTAQPEKGTGEEQS